MDTPLAIRRRIIELSNDGIAQRAISQQLNVAQTTVGGIIRLYRRTGCIEPKRLGNCGRKSIMSAREKRRLRLQCLKNPTNTARELKTLLGGHWLNISDRSTRRYLQHLNFFSFRPSKSPSLNNAQKSRRYRWALAHRNWTVEDWSRVIFSDETYIDMPGYNKPSFVRREKGRKISLCHTVQHRPFKKRIMIWGAVCSTGVGPIAVVEGTMTSAKYKRLVEEKIIPFAEEFDYFQQDNAPSHVSREMVEFFELHGVQLLDWPPYSPDLNVIENIWAVLKMKLRNRHIQNSSQLPDLIKEIWFNDEAMIRTCRSVFQSLPKRINACIKAKGGYLKY